MSNLVIVGTQWGDEGKGKIVDLLASSADAVVRFQGGHNAGHTLVINSKTFKLSLLPSGIVRQKLSIIGNGVVVDPIHLQQEIEEINNQGVEVNSSNFVLSSDCFLILPIHRYIDTLREKQKKGSNKIGTTGRGIGPAYEDKVSRRGIRFSDFKNFKELEEKFISIYNHHNVWIEKFEGKELSYHDDFETILKCYKNLSKYINNTWMLLKQLNDQNKKILFEGAQGFYLDLDHGTYPYVTSSNTVAANASVGSGANPKHLKKTLGITKAYTTRVGNGPFPTEENNDVGEKLGKFGNEFGTVTGRKRRCGWLDILMLKKAITISGINGLVLTKLDVLDSFKYIKICISYKINNQIVQDYHSDMTSQQNVIPIYETLKGWEEKTKGITKFEKLPLNAQNFVKRIQTLVNCNIDIVSTGPERDENIILNNAFN